MAPFVAAYDFGPTARDMPQVMALKPCHPREKYVRMTSTLRGQLSGTFRPPELDPSLRSENKAQRKLLTLKCVLLVREPALHPEIRKIG